MGYDYVRRGLFYRRCFLALDAPEPGDNQIRIFAAAATVSKLPWQGDSGEAAGLLPSGENEFGSGGRGGFRVMAISRGGMGIRSTRSRWRCC